MMNVQKFLYGRHGEYVLENRVGHGSIATVYKATVRGSSRPVAVKVIPMGKVFDYDYTPSSLKNEATIMKSLSHPNIVKIYDYWTEEQRYGTAFGQEPDKAFIVMEYVSGKDLRKLMAAEEEGHLDENTAKKYFIQLINTLEYCHKRGVRHRDINPSNILMDKDAQIIKLCDFGMSRRFKKEELESGTHSPKLKSPVGTRRYMPREVTSQSRGYISAPLRDQWKEGYSGAAADVYSCGITLFEMLTHDIAYGSALLEPLVWSRCNVSSLAKDLICRMVSPVESRITIEEIKVHPWFRD